MVCQSDSPLFQSKVNRQTYQRIGSLFPYTKMYTAVVPTYPGGIWSFTIGSKRYGKLNREKVRNKDTYYVTEQIIDSCFSLPQFVQDNLKNG